MTTLLDEAIARVRELPEAEQDRVADVLMQFTEQDRGPRLTPEQEADVRDTLDGLRDGRIGYLSDAEVDEMWQRLGA